MYKNYEIIKFLYKNQINICYIQFTIFKCFYCLQLDTIIDFIFIYILYIYINILIFIYIYIYIYIEYEIALGIRVYGESIIYIQFMQLKDSICNFGT